MAVCALSILALPSCHGEKGPDFAPVEGVVRINGQPERGLLVRYSPNAEKGNVWPTIATGKTDDQGKYTLMYEYRGKEGPGAAAGWHRVVVLDSKVGMAPQGQEPKPSAVPYAYGNFSTTPLVVEVKVGGPQTIDLEVKK
jgi:hypothetical protein